MRVELIIMLHWKLIKILLSFLLPLIHIIQSATFRFCFLHPVSQAAVWIFSWLYSKCTSLTKLYPHSLPHLMWGKAGNVAPAAPKRMIFPPSLLFSTWPRMGRPDVSNKIFCSNGNVFYLFYYDCHVTIGYSVAM